MGLADIVSSTSLLVTIILLALGFDSVYGAVSRPRLDLYFSLSRNKQ